MTGYPLCPKCGIHHVPVADCTIGRDVRPLVLADEFDTVQPYMASLLRAMRAMPPKVTRIVLRKGRGPV